MGKKEDVLQEIFSNDPLGLLTVKPATSPATENERLLSSFEEINDFFEKENREPKPEGIQERSLYSRLNGIRGNEAKIRALAPHDRFGLLQKRKKEISTFEDILADDELGLLSSDAVNIFDLKNVPKEVAMPDYVARRKPCKNFSKYEGVFRKCQAEITSGKRQLHPFQYEQQIEQGNFFVLKGVLLYVAKVSKKVIQNGKANARLVCIFENGTESDMLLRSLARELYKDGRRVSELLDSFFGKTQAITDEDKDAGLIYVLKSKSENEEIKGIDNLYKIGYSKTDAHDRIKNAENEPTYLMAPVSIVTAFQCYNMNPQKLEQLLHNFFGKSCLNLDVFDKKGKRHTPREWFIAPLEVIEQAVKLIVSGQIIEFRYDSVAQRIEYR